MAQDMIWWDAESYNGRGWKSSWGNDQSEQSEQLFLGPENKMPIPCGDCSNLSYCSANATDCQAFREWTEKGKYALQDKKGRNTIGLRLKAI